MSLSDALDYSFNIHSLECPICKEILTDPRMLPCGHVFCGHQSANCLLKMRLLTDSSTSIPTSSSTGRVNIKCALCSTVHKIYIDNLSPIYGIRDFLENIRKDSSSIGSQKKSRHNNCEFHTGFQVEFLCLRCKLEICKLCFEEKHSWHPIKLKSSIDQQILCKKISETDLTEIEKRCKEGLKRSELKIAELKEKLEEMEKAREQISQFSKSVEVLSGRKSELEKVKSRKLFDYTDPISVEFLNLIQSVKAFEIGNQRHLLSAKENYGHERKKQFSVLLSVSDIILFFAFVISNILSFII